MVCGMTLYQILCFFMIYSVIGWIIEVSYHAVTLGKIVNRGFLNGPLCPVYGSGVLLVLMVLYGIGQLLGIEGDMTQASAWLLFLVGIIFATLVELIAGYLLDKLFHARWWDYSKEKFNFHGYICLSFSIIWGLAITFVLRVVQPTIASFVNLLPVVIGWVILTVCYIVFVLDIVLTTLSVLKLNKQLAMMSELQNSILRISDEMSEVIGNGTLKTVQKLEEQKEKAEEVRTDLMTGAADKKEEWENAILAKKEEYAGKKRELEQKLNHLEVELMYHRMFGMGRLLAAFPDMQHRLYPEVMAKLKEIYGTSNRRKQ